MKNPAAIARELRALGYKFSQTAFLKDLESFEVVFQHGRYKFYNDIVVDMLNSKYKEKYLIQVKVEKPTTDLKKISAMLEAICRELNIKTTTEIK